LRPKILAENLGLSSRNLGEFPVSIWPFCQDLPRFAKKRRGMNALERDGKRWTVTDIDKLEQERDDYKDRWETLGRVAKEIIDRQAKEIQAMKALVK
jgi:hypothetical protein